MANVNYFKRNLLYGGHFECGEMYEVWNREFKGSETTVKFKKKKITEKILGNPIVRRQ